MDSEIVIIGGNGVFEQAKELGLKVKIIESDGSELVVIKRTDLKTGDDKRKLLALADNRTAELAEWDNEALEKLISELPELDLSSIGFDERELAGIGIEPEQGEADAEPQIDKATELNKKWQVKTGDLFTIGEHRLLCGDSTKREDVERVMDGKKADMVLTDPPYGVSYVGKTKDALTIENDDMDEKELTEFTKKIFDNCEYASRTGAYWYATVAPGPLHLIFALDWKNRGILRQIMVWVKDSMVLGHSEYHYQHEPILFGWIDGGAHEEL
jgi:site-specific DNA-methyltransferase (adenine-specific)